MSSDSNNESMPTFRADVSRRWAKKLAKTFQRATQIQNRLNRTPTAAMSVEERNAFFDMQDSAIDELDDLGEQQVAMVAEVVLDMPSDWLEDDAPSDLDWSEAESYDYVLQSKYNELLLMLVDGSAFRDKAKN